MEHDLERKCLKCKKYRSELKKSKNICNLCQKEYQHNYYKENKKYLDEKNKTYQEKNKEQINKQRKQYRQNNKENIAKQRKKYRANNKEKIKKRDAEYQKKNKDKIRVQKNKSQKIKCKENLEFKIHRNVSGEIFRSIHKTGNLKNGSALNYLPFESWQQLKQHIELLFEPWMTWDNWGIYSPKTWDDNDQSTWTWQIDHIIPRADLSYDSMEHPNFKKCWALENLRPYSAKQNVLDGVNRTRHEKNKKVEEEENIACSLDNPEGCEACGS